MADNDNARAPGPVPAEVLAYWRSKGLKPKFNHAEVWAEENDISFSVAKVMRKDVLAAMQQELHRAIADGLPFGQWRKEIEPRFREMGWWDAHEVVDTSTGDVAKVDPPSRLRKIFDTNLRQARAVGQWDRIQRNKRYRPYLLYQLGPSERHRPEHVAWNGLLLPVGDPFWDTHAPSNGFGCKCFLRSVSAREADKLERDGVPAPSREPVLDDEGNPTGHVINRRVAVRREAPPIKLVPHENKRTGRIEMIPEGIDPGFHYKPGEGRERALADAAEE